MLACLDSLAAVAAIVVILISLNLPHFSGGLDSFLSVRITIKNIVLLLFLASAWPVVFHLFRLYEAQRLQHQFGSEAPRLAAATLVGSGLAAVFPMTSGPGSLTIPDLRHFWVASFTFCLLVRAVWRAVDRARHRQVKRALIVGTGPLAWRVFRDIRRERSPQYEVVGFVDDPRVDHLESGRVQRETVGTLLELEQILMRQVIDEVVIALPVKSCYQQIQHAIGVCERAGVQSKYGADLFESTVASPRYDAQGDRAFVAMQVAPDDYRLVIKRAIDIVGAVVGLVVLAPLMLVVAAAIKLTSPGPIVYAQARCGLNKRPFRMFKFRSMVADAERLQASLEERNEARGPVFKIKNDPAYDAAGAAVTQMVFGRAAAILERSARRHVACRSTPAAAAGRGPHHAAFGHAALQHETGTHVFMAGTRPKHP